MADKQKTEQKEADDAKGKAERVTVREYKDAANSTLKGFASMKIVAEGIGPMFLGDMRVIVGAKGPFVGMPSKKVGEKYYDIYGCLSKECRAKITKLILDAFEASFPGLIKNEAPIVPDDGGAQEEVPF